MGGKSRQSLPGAACSALGGSGGAPRVVLLGRGSSFPLPPRKARDTHTQIKMGKDSEPLKSGKGRALNVKVAQTCLALHVSHQFTHLAATDGAKDHEDKMAEDRKYVPNPRVAYGVFEGPTRFGKRVPGDAQVKDPNGIGPCGEEEIRTALGAGMWGGKLPSTWEVIDAEMYAILAHLRKMASERRAGAAVLVLCDCKPALQQIESAHRKGMPLARSCERRS